MGNQPGVEIAATSEQIAAFQKEFCTNYKKYVDEVLFRGELGVNLPIYVGRQLQMSQKFDQAKLKAIGPQTDEN